MSIINADSLTRPPLGIIIIVRAAFGTCNLKKVTVFEQSLVQRKWRILKLTVLRKWWFLKLVVLGREVTPLSTLKTFLLESHQLGATIQEHLNLKERVANYFYHRCPS